MYSIDTNALIDWWWRRYPPDVFPGVRRKMEELIAIGRLRASEVVGDELEVGGDDLFQWASEMRGLFVNTTDDIERRAADLVAQHPYLVDEDSTRPQADQYVIAAALECGWTVVTQETFASTKKAGKRRGRTYIPDVCRHLNVPCINLLQLMRREHWRF